MIQHFHVKVLFSKLISLRRGTSGRSISRILSSGSLRLCSHLSGQRVAALLGAAYPGLCGDEQPPIVRGRNRPCLALLPAGVTWPSALLQMPVVSYTTFSPSPPSPLRARGLFVSVALFRQVSPPRMLSDAVLFGVRTFLDPDQRDRNCPTDLRRFHHTRWMDESQSLNVGSLLQCEGMK
jgi:hypothetical protein